MADQITIVLKAAPRRFGSVAFVAGAILHGLGFARLGDRVAMLGLRIEVG